MRIGISLSSTHAVADGRDGATTMIERARTAREAGLDSLTVGDHHATRAAYYQNTPILGRLLAEWPADRSAGCLFLVPLWHPVLMAEHIGTLASLTDAPFIVQTGVGHGDEQFAALDADLRTRGRVTDERIPIVQRLLAGEEVDGTRIAPVPHRRVEWWIGAGAPRGLDRAARLGDCWYAGPELTLDRAKELLAAYRERCEEHGRTPDRLPLRRDVIVTDEDAEARWLGDELTREGYRGFPPEAPVYGSPDRVAEQLAPFAEAGFTDVIVRVMTGVPADVALRTVELSGTLDV